MRPDWNVMLLLTAWDELDQVVADVSEADMLRQINSGSCFAWTLAHVTYGVDSWINRRFQDMPLNPILSNRRFNYGGDGAADDWPTIRASITDVRDRLRPYLLNLSDVDLNSNRPYADGGVPAFLARGYINLRVAVAQNAIHHYFHLGEIAAKRELMGYEAGDFPGASIEVLMKINEGSPRL